MGGACVEAEVSLGTRCWWQFEEGSEEFYVVSVVRVSLDEVHPAVVQAPMGLGQVAM